MPGAPLSPPRPLLSALPHAERALVLAVRALLDPADCRGWVMWDFGRLFPGAGDAARAFGALRGFAHLLAASARAEPRIHPFEEHELGADEQAVLSLCAAVQAGESARIEALLIWLFPKTPRAAALTCLGAVARMMAENGAKVRPRPIAHTGRNSEAPRAAPLMRVGPVGAHADVGDQRHA